MAIWNNSLWDQEIDAELEQLKKELNESNVDNDCKT